MTYLSGGQKRRITDLAVLALIACDDAYRPGPLLLMPA
jgi:hypothetical protein